MRLGGGRRHLVRPPREFCAFELAAKRMWGHDRAVLLPLDLIAACSRATSPYSPEDDDPPLSDDDEPPPSEDEASADAPASEGAAASAWVSRSVPPPSGKAGAVELRMPSGLGRPVRRNGSSGSSWQCPKLSDPVVDCTGCSRRRRSRCSSACRHSQARRRALLHHHLGRSPMLAR